MIFDPTSSDLHLIWKTFIEFEGFTREPDRDLSLFIEEWKKRMIKVHSTGCQYSDLLLGLKLIEKVNLSDDSIVSVISKLSSSTSAPDSFLNNVVKNIKELCENKGSTENQSQEFSNIIKSNESDQHICEETESKTNLFSCSKCPVKFMDEKSLSMHYPEFHPDMTNEKVTNAKVETRSDSGFLKCPICDKNFMLMETLQKHIDIHDNTMFGSGPKSINEQALFDSSEFDTGNQIDDTIMTSNIKDEIKMESSKKSGRKKKPDKTFKCRICSKEYPKLWKVNKHMKVHRTAKNYKCPYCDNEYKWSHSLKLHLLKMHLEEQSKQNENNPSETNSKRKNIQSNEKSTAKKENPSSSLQLVRKVLNPEEKIPSRTFPCEICGKSFSQYNLKKHIEKTHAAKIYKCDNCPREFSDLSVLERHMKIHNRIHECNVCQKTFKNSHLLRFHMDIHKTTRDLICTYCGKKYKTLNVLKGHLNMHTKARPLPCSFCDKIFFHYESRKYHVIKDHTGEKPFKCDYCDMRFYNSTKKVNHMRTHTGEKPFPCHVCGKCFRETKVLKKHVKNVHKIVNSNDM